MLTNFIYAKTKDLFLEKLNTGNVLNEAIVFIEDTKEIWNHGTFFGGNSLTWRELAPPPTFTVIHYNGDSVEYEFTPGMTWGDFCDSEYNIDGWSASEYEVSTYYYDDGTSWGSWESRWLVTNEGDWYDQDTQPNMNREIISGHTYYEVRDSGGLGGV